MLPQFLLYSKMNQLYIYIYPLPFGSPSYSGYCSALSRVPCAIQYVLISYVFYTQYQQCIYVNSNLPIPPTPSRPPWYPYICSLCLCLYFCFANRIMYTKNELLKKILGLPWWRSGWDSACQCRGHGFVPRSGKIPHAAEQLGP